MSDSQELTAQLAILRQMLLQLPDTISQPLVEQLQIVVDALTTRDSAVVKQISSQLDDIRLNIKTMEFDLDATKAEKQALADKLKDAGLD